MNERIKELAEQAGFECWKDEPYRPEGQVIDWASNYDEELEKFAELVRADEREARTKKPPVKSYCGGKPNYCTPVDNLYMSEERVHKTDKSIHEWVGLTHDEVNTWELPDSPTVFEFAQFIEAKLKEKNNK